MGLLTMYDAVSVENLPPSARYVALYVDGKYANLNSGKARCPHADVLTITVAGGVADCCDCESGDITVGGAIGWVAQRVAAKAGLIVVYASQDTWENQGLKAGLAKYGSRIKRWVAAYPGTGANVPYGYDAHQYSDGGGKLDTSVCLPSFFDAPAPAQPPVQQWSAELQLAVPAGSTGTARFHGSVNLKTGQWTAGGLPGIVHWSGPGGGKWRIKGMPLDASPLGK